MKSLVRAVQILQALAEKGGGASLTQLSQATGIPISSVHRILAGLRSLDLVVQNPGNREYRLGYGLVKLAQPVLARLSNHWTVGSHLVEVRDRWNESCFLASLVSNQVVCLQTVEANDPNRTGFYIRPGRMMPLNCASAGKVILAYQEEEKVEEMLSKAEIRAFTPQTITDKEVLKQHLSVIRDQGYALCEEELEVGVSAVAVPVRDSSGKVESCIAVVAPSPRLRMHVRDGLVEMLKGISGRVSSRLLERN